MDHYRLRKGVRLLEALAGEKRVMYSHTVIVGHLVEDAKLSITQSGTQRAYMRVLTTKKNVNNPEQRFRQQHVVVVWGKRAVAAGELKANDVVIAEGEYRSRKKQDDTWTHELVADRVEPFEFEAPSDYAFQSAPPPQAFTPIGGGGDDTPF